MNTTLGFFSCAKAGPAVSARAPTSNSATAITGSLAFIFFSFLGLATKIIQERSDETAALLTKDGPLDKLRDHGG